MCRLGSWIDKAASRLHSNKIYAMPSDNTAKAKCYVDPGEDQCGI